MKKRKIIAFTGIRSEYDLQFSLAKALCKKEDIDFGFIVFGAHLSEQFGNTVENIHIDNFNIVTKLITLFDSDSHYAKAKSAAVLMNGICDIFANNKPDLIIVAGDREETIVAAIVATYFNIPIAHLFGGDVTYPEGIGDIDEQIRHATTKLANLHFPSHPDHARRIGMLGEELWRIHCFGSPALDKFSIYGNIPLKSVSDYFCTELKAKEYAVLIHHSLPNNIDESCIELENIIHCLLARKIKTFISYPNNDPGNKALIEIIEKHASVYPDIIAYKNLTREIFIPLVKNSSFLIGNSSMGLVECPIMELPAINVGKRQQQRLNAGNVIFCDISLEAINKAIETVLYDPVFKARLAEIKYFYGDGNSGEKIADILAVIPLDNRLLAKQITY